MRLECRWRAGPSPQEAHLVLGEEREREGWCRYSEVDRLVCLGKLIPSISSTKEKVSSTVIDRRVWTRRLGRTEKIQMDLEGERWPGKMGTSRHTEGLLRLMLQSVMSAAPGRRRSWAWVTKNQEAGTPTCRC